jgi:diaminopimelate decarboxylase
MNHSFEYRNSELFAETKSIKEIVSEFGTPLYVYSRQNILENYRAYENAFHEIPHLICFAVKANPQNAILRLLAEEGSGADIVSGGELFRARCAKIPANRIVFAGVGKTAEEIEAALKAKILLFNVESMEEMQLIDRVAASRKTTARIALRLNPDVDAHTHPHIATGRHEDKFGLPIKQFFHAMSEAKKLKNIRMRGLHLHLGSQISSTRPYETAFRKVRDLIAAIPDSDASIDFLDIGGGAAIRYRQKEHDLEPQKLATAILRCWPERKWKIILEPGRSIIGNAGVLITKVLYRKNHFAIVDAGMNDLIRPALYNAYHEIIPVKRNGKRVALISVAGPVCESSDFFAKRRRMQDPASGDLLAILNCGGYGFAMSSQYNSRPRAAEVLVDGDRVHLIRKREKYADLIRKEILL